MKSLFLSVVATLAVVVAAGAQQQNGFPLNSAYDTISTNYAFRAFTNASLTSVLTLNTEPALYHTVHVWTSNSNLSYVIDRSNDNTNWFAGATNVVTSAVVAEATITAKERYLRFRVQGTNITGGINYLGGR